MLVADRRFAIDHRVLRLRDGRVFSFGNTSELETQERPFTIRDYEPRDAEPERKSFLDTKIGLVIATGAIILANVGFYLLANKYFYESLPHYTP